MEDVGLICFLTGIKVYDDYAIVELGLARNCGDFPHLIIPTGSSGEFLIFRVREKST